MRKSIVAFALLLGVARLAAQVAVPGTPSNQVGRYAVSQYGQWSVVTMNGITGGVPSQVFVSNCYPFIGTDGKQVFPFATNAPVTIADGINTETVTPSAVGAPHPTGPGELSAGPYACSITATFANSHLRSAILTSGTLGLEEAINAANAHGGGIAVIDNSWLGQTASITTTIIGFTSATVEDTRTGDQIYSWNGSNYVLPQPGGGTTYTGNSPIVVDNTFHTVACPTCGVGTGNMSTAPAASQTVVQPVNTTLTSNSIQNIHYATTAENWGQSPSGTLTANTPATVTLVPCPDGIDGRDNVGWIYITDNSSPALSEPVEMTGGGSCVMGAAGGGTIKFTPSNSHVAGYTLGSASSGIYESMAAQRDNAGSGSNANAKIITGPAAGGNQGGIFYRYKVRGDIHIPVNNLFWDGGGTLLECSTRDACVEITTGLQATIQGLRMISDLDVTGWPISSVECDITNSSGFDPTFNGMSTITTTGTHAIQVGDIVDILRTDNSHFWGGSLSTNIVAPTRVAGVDSTHVYYPDHNCSNAGVGYTTQTTPGYINILNAPILDNGQGSKLVNITLDKPGSGNTLFAGHFNEGLTIMNDQAAIVDGFTGGNLSSTHLSAPTVISTCTTVNPYCGSNIYSPGPFANAAVLWINNANISLNCDGNGITAFNGNTIHVNNSVIQGQAQWSISAGTRRGGFGNTILDNTYIESGACGNPDVTFPASMGVYNYGTIAKLTGGEGPQGVVPTLATGGATTYFYWLLAKDSSSGTSAPLWFAQAAPTGTTVPVWWPRVAASTPGSTTITYDVIRTTAINNFPRPTSINCTGGSTAACGLVATAVAQCAGLWCTITDDVTVATTTAASDIPVNATYIPDAMFWPGPVVIAGGGKFDFSGTTLLAGATSLAGNATPFASSLVIPGNPVGYVQGLGGNITLIDETNDSAHLNKKGRVIIERQSGSTVQLGHYFTLVDSDPISNLASQTKRDTEDTTDVWIGNDAPGAALTAAGLAFGSPYGISNYIGANPDGTSWLERLNSTSKLIKVPTTITGDITVTGNGHGLAFPFALSGTQVADTFTRANSGTLGGNWTTVDAGTGSACTISNNQAILTLGSPTRSWCTYTGASFANNQFAIATITALTTGVQSVGVRLSNSADTGYIFSCISNVSTQIIKWVAGSPVGLSGTGPACNVGDTILIEVSGSTISASNITQRTSLSASDSAITSGSPGLVGYNQNGASFINFVGGDLAYSTGANITAPIGQATPSPGSFTTLSANAQSTFSVSTGTAPFSVVSTTPVANLTTVPTTYNIGGTQQTGVHIVRDHCTLGTSCSVTLTGSAVFTSSSSYECSGVDETSAAAVKFAPSSGSAFALTGTGTDVISFVCVGN